VTVVSLKADNVRGDEAFKAEFSDGSSFLFATEYLPDRAGDPALWETGRELSSGEEEVFRFAAACYRAEKIALKLVARAEQNSLGLTVKLERRHFDAAVAEAVVSSFLNRKLLDDRRYAELWIRSRLSSRKALSPRWLLVSLGKRGIDRACSLAALKEVLDPETENALLLRYLARAKPGNVKIPGREKNKYLKTQLKFNGFSSAALERYFSD